jgi:hypothetical protein
MNTVIEEASAFVADMQSFDGRGGRSKQRPYEATDVEQNFCWGQGNVAGSVPTNTYSGWLTGSDRGKPCPYDSCWDYFLHFVIKMMLNFIDCNIF